MCVCVCVCVCVCTFKAGGGRRGGECILCFVRCACMYAYYPLPLSPSPSASPSVIARSLPPLRHCYLLCRALRDSTAGFAFIDRRDRKRPEFTCVHVQHNVCYSTACGCACECSVLASESSSASVERHTAQGCFDLQDIGSSCRFQQICPEGHHSTLRAKARENGSLLTSLDGERSGATFLCQHGV